MRRRHLGRPLLVASIGAATVVYSACTSGVSGNLMAWPDDASTKDATSAQDSSHDSQVDAADASSDAAPVDAADAANDAASSDAATDVLTD